MQIAFRIVRNCVRLILSLPLFVSLLCPFFVSAQTVTSWTTYPTTGRIAPTCQITATPSAIAIGGSVTLKWKSTDATTAVISHIGSVSVNGQLNILPSSATVTNFIGTFTGPGGTVTCSATVTVSSNGSSGTGGFGGTYDQGGTYDTNGTYSATPYTISPSSFTTQPSGNSFSQAPNTVGTGGTNAAPTKYLVPCGNTTNNSSSNADSATSCSICSLGTLAQNLINFLLMLSIPIAAGLFAWAGILRFTSAGNASKVAQSTKIFTSVFIGFAIALSGYLIVQTVLNAFLNDSFKAGGFSVTSLTCSSNPNDRPRHSRIVDLFTGLFTSTGSGGVNTGGTPTTGVVGSPIDMSQYCTSGACTNQQAQNAITAYNASNPTNQIIAKSGNVSFDGVNPALLGDLFALARGGNAGTIIVTSANDSSHADNSLHYDGNAVDIGANNEVFNKYIQGLPQVPNLIAKNLPAYKDANGNIWSQELSTTPGSSGPHWHVSPTGK